MFLLLAVLLAIATRGGGMGSRTPDLGGAVLGAALGIDWAILPVGVFEFAVVEFRCVRLLGAMVFALFLDFCGFLRVQLNVGHIARLPECWEPTCSGGRGFPRNEQARRAVRAAGLLRFKRKIELYTA